MRRPLLLGIDLGTTAVKAGLYDRTGTAVGLARAAYPTSSHDALVEQNSEDWWQALRTALGRLATRADLAQVRSIGVVGQVNTHLCVDQELRPLGPAIVWQDQRCANVADGLNRHLACSHRDTDAKNTPPAVQGSHLVARAAWWAEHRPERWARTRWVLSPKDYLTARLTGIVATDALSSRALVDSSGADYASELVALVDGLGERLPGLRSPTEDLGPVAPNDLGLPISARTVVGTMDAWGDIFGNGAIRSGDGFIVGGTSEIVGCVSDRRVPTDGVISFPGSDDGLIVHAGPTQAGGDAARWWAEARGATVAQLVAEAEKAPAGSGGVVFLPHLLGERAPLWDSEARGAFLGLSTSTSPAELSRAVLEGVAFSVRELFEAAEHAAGRSAERITMSGGTARSELWCQITADVLGRPLRRPTVTDTAVLGAALLGGVGTRRFPSMAAAIERAVHVERVFHPDARNVRHYSALFEIYRESYQALRAVHSGFAALRSQARTQD